MAHYALKQIFAVMLLVCLLPQIGMAQFGRAVGVAGGEVIVMKPGGAFGGLATVSVFRETDTADWQLSQRIVTNDAYETGKPLSASLWIQGGELLLGGADPHGKLGAYIFNKEAAGWTEAGKIFVDETPSREASDNMQVSDFMRYVQPPRRVVAVDGNRAVIGVTQGPWANVGAYIFEREEESWEREVHLSDPTENRRGRFGASVALAEDVLVVGAPGVQETGRAFVYEQDADNVWHLTDTLKVEVEDKKAGFGSKLIISSGQIIVGAPGVADAKGAVFVFKKKEAGFGWEMGAHIENPSLQKNAQFGAALSMIDKQLWIGAPNDMAGTGSVYRYQRDTEHEAFTSLGKLEVNGLEAHAKFGASIAGEEGLAVVGSPGGNGGSGEARVFRKTGEDWSISGHLFPKEPLVAVSGEKIGCEDGKAAQFDCEGIDLLSFLPMQGFGAEAHERVSDLWGWTDPVTKHEYALLGRTAGAAIIDVTNPVMPLYVALVPAKPTPTRDLKVYNDHLFFTGDGAGDHGLVIFDLKRLRDVGQTPVELAADTVYTGIASAHNLIIDEESGFAYPVGASRGGETCGGGLHMVDIREPLHPKFAGCYTDTIGLFSDGRTHDGQCVIYRGPDDRYAGRQVCFVSNETALRIVDVTDKTSPEPLAAARYPRVAYVHQGWLTDDHRYFYLDDELDELVGMAGKTRTMVWDIAELDDPILVGEFEGSSTATDHNLYINGDRMYQANYQAGLRVWDVSDPEKPFEIGHFDTTPNVANPPGFVGAWTAYPYFESGTIIVSSMNEGLFIVRPSQDEMP